MISEGAIIGGFISKVINDVVDISKDKIKEADKDRKRKSYNIQCRIYQVIIDAINELTCNKYEGQDKLYDVAETLLKCFKSNGVDIIKSIKVGLSEIISQVDDEVCEKFIHLICREISKEEYDDLYKEIALLHDRREDLKTSRIEGKVDVIIQKMDDIGYSNEKVVSNQKQDKKFQNNKKKDYLKIWNSRMFLHIDNDENPITLAEAFIMPDYKIYKSIDKVGMFNMDTLDEVIDRFVNYRKTSTLLITGMPGIGKSTIISWIANEYIDDDRFIILRFRDWKKVILEKTLLSAICHRLNCEEEDLNNKILILDGFDEMKALNVRDKLLGDFFYNIKDLENFKCIITSRPAYINSTHFHNILEIQQFNLEQIKDFHRGITKTEKVKIENIEYNLEVLGIPVILYMAIMSNVDISEKHTKPELYQRIFSEQGGIFDRFSSNGMEYDNGSQILRNPENIKKYLEFLCETAFKMFEKNDLALSEKECEVPELKVGKDSINILEFPIKHLFESQYNNIEFIHKSIYEYFVSEYIYRVLRFNISETEEKLANTFGELFKSNNLSSEMLEFLSYRINNSRLKKVFEKINVTFRRMLEYGMLYYTGKSYKNVIDCEIKVFANMLELIHLWEFDYLECSNAMYKYLKCNNSDMKLNLNRICLEGQDLNGVNLYKANLQGAYLNNVDLKGANLEKSNLAGSHMNNAKLNKVNFKKANLEGAHMRNSFLYKSDLTGANLSNVDLSGADLGELDLSDTYLEGSILYKTYLELSIWKDYVVSDMRFQLKGADFSYIYVEDEYDEMREKLDRNSVFSIY